MKFVRLRLAGFKSFVDPSEFVIEPGLTGVVGPNGCGKSNLVEALRWVMGESSYKAMRASGMDDVIFSGSTNRPSRNTAEVSLTLDNADRTAPAAFNAADSIEVIRRIEREAGSLYRINGKEVRARDVQLLFADASTGARSPALVRQGQIGELIAAKPQARRAILEEAAGISGLYSRRHEAELRLKGAEQNLDRLEDVLTEIDQQLDNLKRQARQATRYRSLSSDIRRTEATLFHLRWTQARDHVREVDDLLAAARRAVADMATRQGEAARNQAVAALHMPELREAEASAAAALQRLVLARGELEADEKRARARLAELARRMSQLDEDMARERRLAGENEGFLKALAEEADTLKADAAAAGAREAEAAERLTAATARVQTSDAALAEATTRAAEVAARRDGLGRAIRDAGARLARLERESADVAREADALAATLAAASGIEADRDRLAAVETALAEAERMAAAAEAATEAARTAESAARGPLAGAEAELNRHDAEARTLERILAGGGNRKFAPIVDGIKVAPGYEAALGAALGDDLEASLDAAAPARWTELPGTDAPRPLPDGAEPLSARVAAPAALARRLARVGIVDRARGAALQGALAPGQRLVSRDGDLWRWDGFTATAEAPTAATERLAQKNRLEAVRGEVAMARATVGVLKEALAAAQTALADAVADEKTRREAVRAARAGQSEARDALARAERRQSEALARKAALDANRDRLALALDEGRAEVARAESALADAEDPAALQSRLAALRTEVAADRAALAEARAAADGLAREASLRQQRLAAIAREQATWQARIANAESHVATLAERRADAAAEHEALAAAPDEFEERRRALLDAIGKAETARKDAADRLAAAETGLADADRAARDALASLSEAREGQARAEERLKAALDRVGEIEARIVETLEVEPAEVAALAGLGPGAALPAADAIEDRLDRLRQERDRLGSVNLRAEDEVRELTERRDAMISERDDLIEAIRRLRLAIGNLNREGRERLLAAFEAVNGHFRDLFQKLFGGGTAELMLTESDDPLEAGLEILARPPGKKPQTMTLLSGGEQALTAMSLIFAVFLTNPAPICVLDEVDAPLDDANVERFCNLVDEMTRLTDTRFLVITHNPITMARMDRLYGVTMAERGVSQLVSVDLETAERFREAG